jgi:hypothetical protein
VGIHCFRYADKIHVFDRRAKGTNLDEMLRDGYKLSTESPEYIKVTEHFVAITPKAYKFIELEEAAVDNLKCQVETLSKDLYREKHNCELAIKRIKDMEEKDSKRWSTRIKRFFSKN